MATIIVNPYYVSGGGTPSTLLTGLVSWWDLSEASGTRYDSHGSNDLTETGTVGVATGPLGSGNALSLAGAGGLYIDDANQTGLDITGEITLASWVYINDVAASADMGIITKYWQTVGGRSYQMHFHGSTDANRLIISSDGSSTASVNTSDTFSSTTWTLAVARFSPSTDQNLFKVRINNGTDASGSAITGLHDAASTAFCIGCRESGAAFTLYFNGRIGPSAVWNRYLEDSELTELYNSGTALYYADL